MWFFQTRAKLNTRSQMFNNSFKKSFHKLPAFVKPLKSRRQAGLKQTIWKESKLNLVFHCTFRFEMIYVIARWHNFLTFTLKMKGVHYEKTLPDYLCSNFIERM